MTTKILVRFFCLAVTIAASVKASAQDLTRQILIGGVTREYIVHVPKNFDTNKKNSLVLIFHGGGGSAKRSLPFFGLNAVADTAGFIAVYPNGIDKGWNDGRHVSKHTSDDVGFIRQLIVQLKKDYPVDEKRIFATGISNGGFFSFALALHLSDQIKSNCARMRHYPKRYF